MNIFQWCGKFPFGCQSIIDVGHHKTSAGQIHAVALIDLLATVYIATAVNINDDGVHTLRLRTVNIQQIFLAIWAVGDVTDLPDTGGVWNFAVPLAVTLRCTVA